MELDAFTCAGVYSPAISRGTWSSVEGKAALFESEVFGKSILYNAQISLMSCWTYFMPSQPRSKLVADEVCRAMCVNDWSCFPMTIWSNKHFQFPLTLKAGLATILILVMAVVFVIACRRPLLQPAMLVHAVVQLVPLPCAIDNQHLIQLGKDLADILVKQMA